MSLRLPELRIFVIDQMIVAKLAILPKPIRSDQRERDLAAELVLHLTLPGPERNLENASTP